MSHKHACMYTASRHMAKDVPQLPHVYVLVGSVVPRKDKAVRVVWVGCRELDAMAGAHGEAVGAP